jgi:hypothetical protein
MKHILKVVAIAGSLFFALTGCAVTDIDRAVDFNRFRSFTWGTSEALADDPVYKSDLINRNIEETVKEEFAKRGIQFDPENPDFLVSYKTYTEEKKSYDRGPYYPFMPWRFGYFPFAYGYGMFPYPWYYPARMHQYTEGTLIIDIVDNKTKETVWRGTVKGNVEDTNTLQKQIRKGIKAIMKKYPVPVDELGQPGPDVVS